MGKVCLSLLLVCGLCSAALAQPYTILVLKGGGIRGIAYTGAIEVLEERHVLQGIQNVAGTSAGAIAATLISVGYTAGEMKELMFGMKVQAFNDGRWFFIGGQKRLRKNYGWYRGEALARWVGKALQQKTGHADLTFMQLHQLAQTDSRYKDLYVTATNLSLQRAEVFSWRTYPHMAIKTAVRASAAIPLYYSAVLLDSAGNIVRRPSRTGHYQVLVDGGILENYPIAIFDTGNVPNPHTLGLNLQRPEQIAYGDTTGGLAPYNISTFSSYIAAFYNIIIENLNKANSKVHDRSRTIYISTDNMSPRVRGMSLEQKTKLYSNGRVAAAAFLEQNSKQ